jgi:hypothetical protein
VHSLVRRLAFGAETAFARPLGYYTAACALDWPSASLDARRSIATIAVPNRQVRLYPTRDGRVATCFLHRADHALEDFSLSTACRELQSAYGEFRWIVPDLLGQCSATRQLDFD